MNNKFFNQIDDDDKFASSDVTVNDSSQGLSMQNTPFASMLNDSQSNVNSYMQPISNVTGMNYYNQDMNNDLNQQSMQMGGYYPQQDFQQSLMQQQTTSYDPFTMQNSSFGNAFNDQSVSGYSEPINQQYMVEQQTMVEPVQQPMMEQQFVQPQEEQIETLDFEESVQTVQPVQPVQPVQSVQPVPERPKSVIVDVPQQIFEKGIVPDKKEIVFDYFDFEEIKKPIIITLGIAVGIFILYLFLVSPIVGNILESIIVTVKPSVSDMYSSTDKLIHYVNQLKTFFIIDHCIITLLILLAIVLAVIIVKKICPFTGNKNKLAYVGMVAGIALLLNVGMCTLGVSSNQKDAFESLDKMAKLFDDQVSDAFESMVDVYNSRFIIYGVGTIATAGVVLLVTCFKKES